MQNFLESQAVKELLQLRMPRYAELPSLELYMDQVISVIDETLRPLFSQCEGPVLTPTMINNYVKQKLVAAPVKKRYSKEQLAYFLVVALLKPVFSIAEISALIQRQGEVAGADRAYDRFCTELEKAISTIFSGSDAQEYLPPTGEADLLRAAVMSLVNKIYVEKFIAFKAAIDN